MTELRKFMIKKPMSRSAILIHRLIHDLQVAAAARGYFLETYSNEVDQDGFDIILDDKDHLMKIQVKTVSSVSKTAKWKIHKTILRPRPHLTENLGFEPSPEGTGVQGGVILMRFDYSQTSISVEYLCTNVFIITAFHLGIISWPRRSMNEAVGKLYNNLQNGTSHQKVDVRKSAFLKAKSPEHLLALIGLHGNHSICWINELIDYTAHQFKVPSAKKLDNGTVKHLKQDIGQTLKGLTNDNIK